MNRPTVVDVSSDDWRRWRALRLRALAESPEAFGTRLADVHDREASWRARIAAAEACLVALDGDRPVAMVALDRGTDGLVLQSMFVVPEARGRGVGTALVDAVVERAAGRRLVLGVMTENAGAIGVYERAGFVRDVEVTGVPCEVTMRFVPPSKESDHAR